MLVQVESLIDQLELFGSWGEQKARRGGRREAVLVLLFHSVCNESDCTQPASPSLINEIYCQA